MFYLFNSYMLKKQPDVTQNGFLFVFLGFSICRGISGNLIILCNLFLVDFFLKIDIY